MGRIYSGKPSRDTETAAESVINNNLTSGTLIKMQGAGICKSVFETLQSSTLPDDFGEKKL